jgi:hypothetical protein
MLRRIFMANEQFLVQVDSGRFLVEFDGASARVTDTPSMSAQLSYSAANSACQRLRKRGFRQSCVCDVEGNVMTFEAIREVANALHAAQAEASLPKTFAEYRLLSNDECAARRQDPAFARREKELLAAER